MPMRGKSHPSFRHALVPASHKRVLRPRDKHAFLLSIFNFFLTIQIFLFISFFYCQMAAYTENDVRNALADMRNGGTIATAATHHGVPRTTLRDRLKGARSC